MNFIVIRFGRFVFLPMISLIVGFCWSGTFKDDFDDGNAIGWKIEENAPSKWEVINGGYSGSIATNVESIALIGEDDWDVSTIDVKIRDAQGSWLAVVFRYQDINNFDAWWLNIPSKTLEAWPKIGNYENSARVVKAVPFDPQKEFTLGIKIVGNDFTAFFDGKEVGIYTNDKFKSGRVGLLVWESSATFDDVIITGKNVSGLMVVDNGIRCPQTWGAIKSKY